MTIIFYPIYCVMLILKIFTILHVVRKIGFKFYFTCLDLIFYRTLNIREKIYTPGHVEYIEYNNTFSVLQKLSYP